MAKLYSNCFSFGFDLPDAQNPSFVMGHDFAKTIVLLP